MAKMKSLYNRLGLFNTIILALIVLFMVYFYWNAYTAKASVTYKSVSETWDIGCESFSLEEINDALKEMGYSSSIPNDGTRWVAGSKGTDQGRIDVVAGTFDNPCNVKMEIQYPSLQPSTSRQELLKGEMDTLKSKVST